MKTAKKLFAALLVQSLAASLALAATAADAPPEKKKRRMPPHGIPADIKAEVDLAADRISGFYAILGPKLGAHLTNPNVVLMMADERGLADDNFFNWSEDDIKAVERFNKEAESQGFRILRDKEEEKIGKRELQGWFENLHGYERESKETHLPKIPQFNAVDSWKGLAEWKAKAIAGIQQGEKEGIYPSGGDKTVREQQNQLFPTVMSNQSASAYMYGIAYGYPDTAVLAPPATGPCKSTFTKIPYADYQLGPQPNYCYSSNADLDAVNKNVYRWGTILGEYYHSPGYLKLAADKEFQAAREKANNRGRE